MTDKEKIRAEIERRIEELQPCNTRENLRAHGAIAGYYQILSFINSMQEEPAPKVFEDMLNAKTAAESPGISPEEHDKIVDECLYGKEPELVDEDDLPTKKDYRERYKRIAKSESFKKAHEGMSIGEVIPVEEQEPVSEDLEKIVEEIAEPTILNAYGTKELARRLRNTICGTSVSEGLEEASKNYALNNTPWDDCKDEIQESFKAGAQWQKEKNESTTEDLGEYINELSKQFPEVSFAKLSRIAVRVAKWQKEQFEKDCADLCNGIATAKGLAVTMAYDKGMADAKEQMMAKAIDGDITFDYYGDDDKTYGCIAHDSFCLEDFGLKDRDKVKMILIKEKWL